MWYNTTSEVLKYQALTATVSWAAGGNLGTARSLISGAGTQTVGLGFGGSGYTAATEEYNGSAWTGGGNMGDGRRLVSVLSVGASSGVGAGISGALMARRGQVAMVGRVRGVFWFLLGKGGL